ncbi:MAG: GNAT family N-acetyltransferase [Bdellovibrionaceae bacterium]|nr:GNAT family N-acetyltransferase [Pseudobdellovibrionaceae bacterium]|tara:strand:+ start:53238 stop:53738 length:501 start_codon:yes stop_codon:yes gene_type:complete
MNQLQTITLPNELRLEPIDQTHFDVLMEAISDPAIWAETTFSDRWQKEKREKWFKDALENKYTYVIFRADKCIGSTRYYDFDSNSVSIGYTFFIVNEWGSGANRFVKDATISLAKESYPKVLFKIDEKNIRSIKAVEKLGGQLIKTIEKHKKRSDGTWRTTKIYSI